MPTGRRLSLLLPLLSGLALSCTSESGSEKGQGSGPSTAGPDEGSDAQADSRAWSRIIEGDWKLAPGEEILQQCVQQTLDEDVYVSAIRPVHPLGTHHTLVTLGDGSTSCTSSLISNGIIYAAGVGSKGLELPPGVALKFPKGSVLSMGLHLYNVTDGELTGTSAMEIVRLAPEEVEHEAEALLAGPLSLSIPPGRQTVADECTVNAEQTVFAVFPHMHQYGVHLTTTVTTSGTPKVIHDGPYDFEEQEQIVIDPVKLAPGDKIATECTYENTTAQTLGFGESSDTEMCFSILFRYPAQGVAFCTAARPGSVTLDGPPCAAEGAPGNDVGVGKECSGGGGQCGAGTLCLADYVSGDFGNFCTLLCAEDRECGAGARCSGSGSRAICVPDSCAETLANASAGQSSSADAGAGG
jgi:hypothetical protein